MVSYAYLGLSMTTYLIDSDGSYLTWIIYGVGFYELILVIMGAIGSRKFQGRIMDDGRSFH